MGAIPAALQRFAPGTRPARHAVADESPVRHRLRAFPVALGIEIRPVIFIGKVGFEPLGKRFYFSSFKMKVKAYPGALPFGIVGAVKTWKRAQSRNALITICDVQLLLVTGISCQGSDGSDNGSSNSGRIADCEGNIPHIVIFGAVIGPRKLKRAIIAQVI